MANSPKRIYWDACSWIALIQNEVVIVDGIMENRGALCRSIIKDAVAGKIEILSSALILVEVNKGSLSDASMAADKLKEFFENDYIAIVSLDREAGELGRTYMQRGFSKLKPPDASHLASAAITNVEEMHTFDKKLLDLDGKVTRKDGTPLRICKPGLGGPPLPLMETAR